MLPEVAHCPAKQALRVAILCLGFTCAATLTAHADEIRLKDGKKLYGVIVAYEDNMFKVKTDFGYVLVEKDKIASIIPTTPAAESSTSSAAQPAGKNSGLNQQRLNGSASRTEPPSVAQEDASLGQSNAGAKFIDSPEAEQPTRLPRITNSAVRPALPFTPKTTSAVAPNLKATLAPTSSLDAVTALAAPKEPQPDGNREEVQGNLYINYTNGFRMYKAPSWQLMEDARSALPNAIVAMGTTDESTLLVVGRETTKETLNAAAKTVESRLQDVYENYQRISQRKTTVGGLPAIEIHYQGKADDHDWSGTLAIVARGSEVFTVLGMTYADSDLIQIQENVIARTISSLNFTTH